MNKAAVLTELNAPLEIRDLEMPYAKNGEVGVRMLMSGICGAQLQEIRGEKGNADYIPHLLGHEGVGVVETVGHGSDPALLWQKVCLHWRKGNGPDVCKAVIYKDNAGGARIGAGPIATWAQHVVVSANRVTPIADDVPDELACLLGCCLSTAIGVVENEAKVRMGERVLVIGCGGVGLACIMAAKAAGGIVSAMDNKPKGQMARYCGANHFVSAAYGSFDVIIDTTGWHSDAVERGLEDGGRFIMVGQAGAAVNIKDGRSMFRGEGQTIKATQGGGFQPSRDLARYCRAPLEYQTLITHRISLDQINDGLDIVRSGMAGRVLIDFSL